MTLEKTLTSFKRLQEVESLISDAQSYISTLEKERALLIKICKKTTYVCQKCHHEWHPRSSTPPRLCPNCKTKFWHPATTISKE